MAAMLVVKKIINIIFPVSDIPQNGENRKKIEVYFEEKEMRKSKDSKGNFVWVMLVLIIDIYFCTINTITIVNKLLLIVPLSSLLLRGIYLQTCYKKEKNCLKVIKLRDEFAMLCLFSLLLALGSVALSLFVISETMGISQKNFFYIVILGFTWYFSSYVIGYHMQYKRVIEKILNGNANSGKNNKGTISGAGMYAAIGLTFSWLTYKYHIIPEPIACIAICILIGIGFFMIAPVWAECRFYNKMYEREEKEKIAENEKK